MATPKGIGQAFSNAGRTIFSDLKSRALEFSDAVESVSKDLANKILQYEKSIAKIAVQRLQGTVKTRDANVAIRNYRQATKSAMADISDIIAWDAYHTFWTMVSDVMRVISKIITFLF